MREMKFRVWDKILNKMVTQENVYNLIDEINEKEDWYKDIYNGYSRDEWYPAYNILAVFKYFDKIAKNKRFIIMQYTRN